MYYMKTFVIIFALLIFVVTKASLPFIFIYHKLVALFQVSAETGKLQAPIKFKEIFNEISDFFKDIYDAFLYILKSKSKHSSSAWSVSKAIKSSIKNVKYGYASIVEFLPSPTLSKEAFNMFVPIFSNASFIDRIFL